jgi:uncharacterized 2Fe-2S/4Fe-4S cluster protein (DUF4445 family)
MRQAGVAPSDLNEVLVAGVFGRTLDPANAMALGLLPTLPVERVHALGNSALKGCQDLLVSTQARDLLAEIRNRYSMINLAAAEHFQDLFLDHLYLRPQSPLPWGVAR